MSYIKNSLIIFDQFIYTLLKEGKSLVKILKYVPDIKISLIVFD